MSDTTLDAARARYVDDLQRVHPQLDDQMSDVLLVLRALLGDDHPSIDGPLNATRANYLARLRERYRNLDEQLMELARAGAHLFGPALGLTAAA
jgi:hypothetical protein